MKMVLHCLIFPLLLTGMLMWPAFLAQDCLDEVPQDVLFEAQFIPADNKTFYPEDQISNLLAKESLEIQEYIQASQTLSNYGFGVLSDSPSKDTCQRYDFMLPYKSWYFVNSQLKCFSLQPLYMTSCKTRYCRWNKEFRFFWWFLCVQEWRYQHFWSVCMEKGIWSVRYESWKLPACCNCVRYYKYTQNKCPITITTTTVR